MSLDFLPYPFGSFASPGTRARPREPKIGVEEFFAIAERFGFRREALDRLHRALSNDDLPSDGPNLGRWGASFPTRPSADVLESLARRTFGVRHALAVSSGTAALHAAFVGVGVGPGDEVICSALGFVATAMAVILAGGTPVFCDVDESLHLDPGAIEPRLTARTVAIAPTHHWGGVADMAGVLAVARRHGLAVVEDCAQSPGARFGAKPVGSIGDAGCFSLSAAKIVGGGECGLLITNDDRTFDRARQLAEGGGLWRPERFAPPRWPGELFPGANYRVSELEAAVAAVQLGKLDAVCERHRRVSRRVRVALGAYAAITPQRQNDADGVLGCPLRFFPDTFARGERIARALRDEGLPAAIRGGDSPPDWHLASQMFPVTLAPAAAIAGDPGADERRVRSPAPARGADACPVADDLYRREVTVTLDPWWSEPECDAAGAAIDRVLRAFSPPGGSKRGWS